jgi:hypothetical protein
LNTDEATSSLPSHFPKDFEETVMIAYSHCSVVDSAADCRAKLPKARTPKSKDISRRRFCSSSRCGRDNAFIHN